MTANYNVSNTKGPYVCLSAHCELLHFCGSVQHNYGGPTLQTIAERASRCVNFSCELTEMMPAVTVKATRDNTLFPPLPFQATDDGALSPLSSGIELAQRAFREHFEVPARGHNFAPWQHEGEPGQHHLLLRGSDLAEDRRESGPPSPPAAEPQAASGSTPPGRIVNVFALRRTLLQALFVLNLPKRSPAAAFTVCQHDAGPFGATTFLVLPRSAKTVTFLSFPARISIAVAATALATKTAGGCSGGYALQCCCDCHTTEVAEQDNKFLCPPLLWELDCSFLDFSSKGTMELSLFLTETMTPLLFLLSDGLKRPEKNEDVSVTRVAGWCQRRSFQLLALIAHCVWCEKVAWYIMSKCSCVSTRWHNGIARLKARSGDSLDSADKWETELLLHGTVCKDNNCNTAASGPFTRTAGSDTTQRALLRVTLRGCDERMEWKWGDDNDLDVSCGGLRDLTEAECFGS